MCIQIDRILGDDNPRNMWVTSIPLYRTKQTAKGDLKYRVQRVDCVWRQWRSQWWIRVMLKLWHILAGGATRLQRPPAMLTYRARVLAAAAAPCRWSWGPSVLTTQEKFPAPNITPALPITHEILIFLNIKNNPCNLKKKWWRFRLTKYLLHASLSLNIEKIGSQW